MSRELEINDHPRRWTDTSEPCGNGCDKVVTAVDTDYVSRLLNRCLVISSKREDSGSFCCEAKEKLQLNGVCFAPLTIY